MKELFIHLYKVDICSMMLIDLQDVDEFIEVTLKPCKTKLEQGLVKRSDYSIELLNSIECLMLIESLNG